MNCKEFRTQVADLFDKEVNPQTKAECERHMATCPSCRSYYEDLSEAAALLRPRHTFSEQAAKDTPVYQSERLKKELPRRWGRVAAVFAVIVVAVGIAYAAGWWARARFETSPQAKVTTVHFKGESLDSILSVVAPYYKKTVVFRDEAPRQLQLIMTWNPATSFDDFVRRLNAFDGLLLTVQHDTLFVEANSADEK